MSDAPVFYPPARIELLSFVQREAKDRSDWFADRNRSMLTMIARARTWASFSVTNATHDYEREAWSNAWAEYDAMVHVMERMY